MPTHRSSLFAAILPLVLLALLPAAAEAHVGVGGPAGGAALTEIVIASTGAFALTSLLGLLGVAHRRGRTQMLSRAAAAAEARVGLPGWVALPSALATAALLTALLGMYWDISLHIDDGRDAGPLANPAHYFILAGLFGIFSAGFLAMVLPLERPGPSAVRITQRWHAPAGGVLILACGAFALSGFPLDDVWHRLFGQDVTLWGPTHLMLIGGASLTLIGLAILHMEGLRASGQSLGGAGTPGMLRLCVAATAGGLLIGLSTFQAEFDFGVPQFSFLYQPLLITLAASIGLITARAWAGRGTALAAVAFFLVVRGALAVLVGPILGETTPHVPLYLVSAVLIELAAGGLARRGPLAFGLGAGALVGTLGLASEWAWSHVWMPLPWPGTLLPEAALVGVAAGLAGGVIGTFAGTALRGGTADLRPFRLAAPASAVVVALLVGLPLLTSPEPGVRARVALEEVRPAPEREVTARVRIEPAAAAEDADWLTLTSWQGRGMVLDRLRPVGPGVFASTRPVPVHGTWKTLVRLHRGRSILGAPVYLPADRELGVPAVPAAARFTRPFTSDKAILQREAKAASWMTPVALGVVVTIAIGLIALLAAGLLRLAASRDLAQRRAGSARAVGATPGAAEGIRSRQPLLTGEQLRYIVMHRQDSR